MKSFPVEFVDTLNITKPFVLFLGRKSQLISKPSRFEIQRTHVESTDEESGLTVIGGLPVRQTYSLFIDGRLFSVTRPSGSRRFSGKIVKPTDNRKPLEIHLVKKYTRLSRAA